MGHLRANHVPAGFIDGALPLGIDLPAVCIVDLALRVSRLTFWGSFSLTVSSLDSMLAGISATTSLAGLSLRKPLKDAWRIIPELVQPANSISATSLGFNHRTSWSSLC
jgi:hypothetical protein